jgi:peptidylprolyl isomerase
VVEASDDSVKIDANHPLAGKELVFDLELVEIE